MRLTVGVLACMVAMVLLGGTAWASSISVTAAPSGSALVVQVSGTADDCSTSGCTAQNAEVEATPYTDYAGECIEPESPQSTTALATSGGAFSYTATIPVDPGQEYAVCGYVVPTSYGISVPSAASQAALVTVAPAACPAGTEHALSLSAPSVIAYGRKGVVVVSGDANTAQSVASGTVTIQEPNGSVPFYSYTLTRSDVVSLTTGGQLSLDFELTRQDGPARVTLTYQEDQSDSSQVQCIDQNTATVSPFVGRVPSARLLDGLRVGVAFSAPGGCALTKQVAAAITVTGPDANWSSTSPDECSGSWRTRGRIRGISTRRSLAGSGATVAFNPAGQINASYALVVRIGGRVIKRAVLSEVYYYSPPMRVFEGTDAFVNYCIDQNKTVYSYNLRLFCWQPAITIEYLRLTRS